MLEELKFIDRAVNAGNRVLGICLGAQSIAKVLGSNVIAGCAEIGWFSVYWKQGYLKDKNTEAFHWHFETFKLPSGATHLARSEACENQAFSYSDNVLALQCHLEVTNNGVKSMVDNSTSDLLLPGNFVQTSHAILQGSTTSFPYINNDMYRLLDKFLDRNS